MSENTVKAHAGLPRLALILAGLATLALLLTSCGDSEDSVTTSAGLTKAQFIKQGDAICEDADEQLVIDYEAFLKAHGIKGKGVLNKPQNLEYLEEIYVPNIEDRLEDLQQLSPPEGDEAQVEEIFVATEDAIAMASKDAQIVVDDNPFEEPKTLTQDYGFQSCGEV